MPLEILKENNNNSISEAYPILSSKGEPLESEILTVRLRKVSGWSFNIFRVK